jgi:hypothetical protein
MIALHILPSVIRGLAFLEGQLKTARTQNCGHVRDHGFVLASAGEIELSVLNLQKSIAISKLMTLERGKNKDYPIARSKNPQRFIHKSPNTEIVTPCTVVFIPSEMQVFESHDASASRDSQPEGCWCGA